MHVDMNYKDVRSDFDENMLLTEKINKYRLSPESCFPRNLLSEQIQQFQKSLFEYDPIVHQKVLSKNLPKSLSNSNVREPNTVDYVLIEDSDLILTTDKGGQGFSDCKKSAYCNGDFLRNLISY
jgi:hypothetical protein